MEDVLTSGSGYHLGPQLYHVIWILQMLVRECQLEQQITQDSDMTIVSRISAISVLSGHLEEPRPGLQKNRMYECMKSRHIQKSSYTSSELPSLNVFLHQSVTMQ